MRPVTAVGPTAGRMLGVPSRTAAAWPIVVVTTFFPSSTEPQRTVFVKNLVKAMRSLREVTVISPVPKRPWPFSTGKSLPARADVFEDIPVSRPRFTVIPALGWLSGFSYFVAVLRTLSDIQRRRGRFVLHAHCAYPDGVGVALAARWLRLPCVVTAHGSDINVYSARPSLRPQIAWALRHVSAVIAVSQALRARVTELVGGADTEISCIPCAGFDAAVFMLRDRSAARMLRSLDAAARVAVFVGQLVPLKQVDRLIEAWGILSRRGAVRAVDRLVIIGAGPEDTRLRRQAQSLGLESSVLFVGVIPQTEVSEWVVCADLLCLPSRIEGTPNVIVEALASGIPVVASRVGGIPDLVVDDCNGCLVPPGDSLALADGLHRCFTRPWDRNAVRRSAEHLTWSSIAALNIELIDRVTEKVAHASVV